MLIPLNVYLFTSTQQTHSVCFYTKFQNYATCSLLSYVFKRRDFLILDDSIKYYVFRHGVGIPEFYGSEVFKTLHGKSENELWIALNLAFTGQKLHMTILKNIEIKIFQIPSKKRRNRTKKEEIEATKQCH